ncbi:MAG: hypothetical protein MK212_17020 [Saprospiraceae bacterium]|nr:hypothetical protein [Saprospiraceae bacterium]
MDLKKLSMERIYYRLDKAAAEPTEVYRLYVDEFTNTWEEIAEVLAQCEHLQELTVAGEFFQVLPEEILRFKGQLQILTLKENPSLNLGEICTQLKHFEHLHTFGLIAFNAGAFEKQYQLYLPEELGQLKHIKKLDLSESRMDTLGAIIGQLRTLQSLNLASTGVKILPKEIQNLKQLEWLDLGQTSEGITNNLKEIPKEIFKLKKLKYLGLKNLSIRAISKRLSGLKNLEELDFSDCQKIEGKDLFSLLIPLKNLKTLNLSDIKINGVLPAEIGKLRSIEVLDLSYCGITRLPAEMSNLGQLKYLNLKKNKLLEQDKEKVKEWFPKVDL